MMMDNPASRSVDIQSAISATTNAIAFKTELSLVALIEFWTREAGNLRYLTPGAEELELAELQGVQGLRALRVGIELDNPRPDGRVPLRDLEGMARPR